MSFSLLPPVRFAKKDHWLAPFADYITGISFDGDTLIIEMHIYIGLVDFDFPPEKLQELGIKQIDAHTPTASYRESETGCAIHQHTGDMFLTLYLEQRKNELALPPLLDAD